MTSQQALLITFCAQILVMSSLLGSTTTKEYSLEIKTDSYTYKTDKQFLSVALGMKEFNRTSDICKPSSKKAINMGLELKPATLRLGGTASHYLTFDPDGKINQRTLPKGHFTMTGKEWERIAYFAKNVGWDLIWDFNLFHWKDSSKKEWDPTNAKLLLNYSEHRDIPIKYFQLGNEVGSYSFKFGFVVTEQDLINHFNKLRDVLAGYKMYKDSKLVGPDLSGVQRKKKGNRKFLQKFMKIGGGDALDIYGQHQYYANGRTATLQMFLSPDLMDCLLETMNAADEFVFKVKPDIPFWLTETSSCYGGGAPSLSDRYVAGFLWLDKLGVSAQRGVNRVMRQVYCGPAKYAMISPSLKPYPDYFLSVLYKRLIEGPVFSVVVKPPNRALRVYAHCARVDVYGYPQGALAVYYLNTENAGVTLKLTEYPNADLDLFQLTSSDARYVYSMYVNLNGKKLTMQGDNVPPLNPRQHRGPVKVQSQSFGFVIVKNAQVPSCQELSPSTSGVQPSAMNQVKAQIMSCHNVLLFVWLLAQFL